MEPSEIVTARPGYDEGSRYGSQGGNSLRGLIAAVSLEWYGSALASMLSRKKYCGLRPV